MKLDKITNLILQMFFMRFKHLKQKLKASAF